MKIAVPSWQPGAAIVAITLLALTLGPPGARADDPMLALRLAGGESAIYPVSDIERLGFEGDAVVVVSAAGSDSYPAETIARIEFLWDFSGVEDPEAAPALLNAMHLFQNQPNPFSPQTRIRFELPVAGRVQLAIYGVSGRLIRTLVDEERGAGAHLVDWDGRDDGGHRVPGGVYFSSLAAPGIGESRQMILLP